MDATEYLPRVVIHNAVTVDGRMDWFSPNQGLYYELASRMNADAILAGSNTILDAFPLSQFPEIETEESNLRPSPTDPPGQILIIVDHRGRIRNLRRIRQEPYWRDVIVLCSLTTPPAYHQYLEGSGITGIATGADHVDLREALRILGQQHDIKVVRVDSGGILNGALLREGLVHEVSIVVEPFLVGGMSPRSMYVAPDLTSPEAVVSLKLVGMEELNDNTVRLRYEVVYETAT